MERYVEFLNRVVREEEGQDLVEYAILLAFIALACVVAVTALGTSISSLLGRVGAKLDAVTRKGTRRSSVAVVGAPPPRPAVVRREHQAGPARVRRSQSPRRTGHGAVR
jgi:pilus assembly protein Flp/PilA